jgi:Tfp pilus assembly major pilin PilA
MLLAAGFALLLEVPTALFIAKRSNETKRKLMLFASIILGGVVLISQWMDNPPIHFYNLSEEDMDILTEEYEFISDTSKYPKKINKIVDEEKEIIDKYVSNQLTKEQVVEKLTDTLRRKNEIKEDYIELKPKEKEVITTKSLSDDIINNTIAYTESAINSIDVQTNAKIVGNFNLHIEENNSNIYMYNQYVISVFESRGIAITYDGVNFAMDTKWLEDNKD